MKRNLFASLGVVAIALTTGGSFAATLQQYGATYSGLSWSEVNGSNDATICAGMPAGTCVQENTTSSASKYGLGYEDNAPGKDVLYQTLYGNGQSGGGVNSPVSDADVAARLGQFRYNLFYDKDLGTNSSATTMNQINWRGGEIVFLESTKDIVFVGSGKNDAPASSTTWLVHVLGGTIKIDTAGDPEDNADDQADEDLPFRLGLDHKFAYEAEDGSSISLRITNQDNAGQYVQATFLFNDENLQGANDPFNGILMNPNNNSFEDIAFFIHGHAQDVTCVGFTDATCGGFGNSKNQDTDDTLDLLLSGWGTDGRTPTIPTPEPAALGIMGIGLLGLIVLRRRRQ